jgi:hypothetical protein
MIHLTFVVKYLPLFHRQYALQFQFKQQTVEKFRPKLWWNVNISWMWIQCWTPTALKCTGSGEGWPHWVVFCRSLCVLLVIVLSVLLGFAASDYRFGKITEESLWTVSRRMPNNAVTKRKRRKWNVVKMCEKLNRSFTFVIGTTV